MSTTTTPNAPNSTLYVKNIDWKIKKSLLRKSLYSLFTRHGKVIEIITLRKDGLRGQAFVIMDDVIAATSALSAEQNINFYGKDLMIEYAKQPSHRNTKNKRQASSSSDIPNNKRRKVEPSTSEQEEEEEEEMIESTTMKTEENEQQQQQQEGQQEEERNIDIGIPSHILLINHIPSDCTDDMLIILFQSYPGYKEVRIPRPGIAFIEFQDEPYATIAMRALQKYQLTSTIQLQILYAVV